jgi:adhesin transport system membrane fusion protein
MPDSTSHLEDLTTRLKPKAASNLLLWGVVGFFVIFLVWASLTELDRTVRGAGRVVPSSQLQVVSNLEGGVVEAILVRTGQTVRQGAELVRLDQTQTGSELGSGQASVAALAAKIARLQAEITGRQPIYPRASDAAGAQQIEIERSLHASRQAAIGAMQAAGQARIVQSERAVAEAQSAYTARLAAKEARTNEVAILRPLVARGIEPRMSLTQAESAAAVAAAEAASQMEAISRARAAVSEARSSLATQMQDWRAQAANELAAAQAELDARRKSIPALAERMERTVVRAPLPGRVNRVLVTTVGGSVAPGAPLVEIVPSEDSLLVEVRVRPQDIAFVRHGQKAKVSITAYDPSVYGSLDGEVIAISPDAVLEERTGETFYTVRVRTASNALKDRVGTNLPIGPGMVADVSLLGDKRTILQYLLTPITRLSETAFRE